MQKPNWTDENICRHLTGTEPQRVAAERHIYYDSGWWQKTWAHVRRNQGQTDAAREVFDESVLSFCAKIATGFRPNGPLEAYFMGIVKRQWLKIVERRKRWRDHEISPPTLETPDFGTEIGIHNREHAEIARDILENHLGKRCRDIILLFQQGHSMAEIAEMANIPGGADAAKRDKPRCQERFKKIWYERLGLENPFQTD